MKIKTKVLILAFLHLGMITQAQILKKLGKKAEKAAERTVLNRTDNEVSEKTDQVLDSVLLGKKKKQGNEQKKKDGSVATEGNEDQPGLVAGQEQPWSKYNFVPGDEIIFEDDLVEEENGEFPSRWDLLQGAAENASFHGDNIINFKNKTLITPLMEEEHYLPEIFTIEFDAYFDERKGDFFWQYYTLAFSTSTGKWYTLPDSSSDYYYPIYLYQHGANLKGEIKQQTKEYKTYEEELKNQGPVWRHIAIAFSERSLKVFVDEYRVLNIPNLGFKPQVFSLGAYSYYDDGYIRAIKNIRLAEGGKKPYDRILAEGKFVTRGILFDVNKATIKPESYGVINEVAKMMQGHPDLNFSIEGHTDSDGSEEHNQGLSEQRAASVMKALISIGIAENRMQSKGLGETIPVSENTTPEGKANNRRVEFVKI